MTLTTFDPVPDIYLKFELESSIKDKNSVKNRKRKRKLKKIP